MPRQPRIHHAGANHHIVNRGVDRQPIYLDDDDRRAFLWLLAETHRRFSLRVHAFCLMGNHFHLLVHMPGDDLAQAMRHLTGRYASLFNVRHDRDGPLFRGRYQNRVVDDDGYLVAALRYIHLNPVAAGLVSDPAQHRWSSHAAYLGGGHTPRWLDTRTPLEVLGGRDGYRQLMADSAAHDDELSAIAAASSNAERLLRAIDSAVATSVGCAADDLRRGHRGQANPGRVIAAGLAARFVDLDLVACHYGLGSVASVRTIRRRLERRVVDEPQLDRCLQTICSRVSSELRAEATASRRRAG